jgi:hypothetical protein
LTALGTIQDALATQLQNVLCSAGTADPLIEQLQVDGRFVFNPTPPAIDIYPADPFQEGIAFGHANNDLNFIVRARVHTADHEAGQDLLLSMMDPDATTSVALAILTDKTLGSTVGRLSVTGPSGFGVFPNASGVMDGSLLGCTWNVRVFA